jgi:nucleoside-diphosphate-sugar epimerase
MSYYSVNKSNPVLVTGATGYVAGVLIKELLDEGLTVHATVRDASKKDRFQYLQELADKSPGNIKFFSADLLKQGSFKDSMQGCSVVFHTASPFIVTGKDTDPQTDLVEPAVMGTENVLNEATNTTTVKRVVLTSSVAAINSDASDAKKTKSGALTEDNWNRKSSLDYGPYSYSKTLAEQKAWTIAGTQAQWTLNTINPSFVMGPGLKYHETSESYKSFIMIAGGELKSACPGLAVGVVDVRDVAHAHVVAGFAEKATGRHILSASNTSFFGIAQALLPKYKDYPIPTFKAPFFILYMIGPYLGSLTREFIWNNMDVETNLDNTKSKKDLGIEYRSLEETLGDMMEQLIAEGVVNKSK